MAWGVVTVVLPHLSVSLRMTTTMVFVFIWASIMAFVRTASFDILDMGWVRNKLVELALRFGSYLADLIEQNHRNSRLFRGFCE